MNHLVNSSAPLIPAESLPNISELRLLENFLDWMENQDSRTRRHWSLVVFPLLPVIAIAAPLWRCIARG